MGFKRRKKIQLAPVVKSKPAKDEFLAWLTINANKKVTMELKDVLKVYKKYN